MLHCNEFLFLKTEIMFANFNVLQNIPFSKKIMITFSGGKMISSEKCFESLVVILFGPINLHIVRILIMFSIYSRFVGVRMKEFHEGSVR